VERLRWQAQAPEEKRQRRSPRRASDDRGLAILCLPQFAKLKCQVLESSYEPETQGPEPMIFSGKMFPLLSMFNWTDGNLVEAGPLSTFPF